VLEVCVCVLVTMTRNGQEPTCCALQQEEVWEVKILVRNTARELVVVQRKMEEVIRITVTQLRRKRPG